jgi:hypothetical protein
MKVNLFGIGSAKCGTTTLFDILDRHPDICGSSPKEADFFASLNNFEKGYRWYHETCFFHYSGQKFLLDITPNYSGTNFQTAAKRLHSYNPEAKLIYLLRDPFERLCSEWAMCLRNYKMRVPSDNPAVEWAKLGFSAWAERLWHSGLIRPIFYGSIINCYLEYYRQDSMCITTLEALSSSFEQEMAGILDFIGLSPSCLNLSTPTKSNAGTNLVGRFAGLAPLMETGLLSKLPKARRVAHGLRREWFLRSLEASRPSMEPFIKSQLTHLLIDDYRSCHINLDRHVSQFASIKKQS